MKAVMLTVLITTILAGCVSNKQAVQTVSKLNTVTMEREKKLITEIENLSNAYLDIVFHEVDLQISKEKESLKAAVLIRINERHETLLQREINRINGLFKPEIDSAEAKLIAAQSESRISGNRTKEINAALELAAGLAAQGREAFRISQSIRRKFEKLRTKSLKDIEEGFANIKSDMVLGSKSDIEKELKESLKASTETYSADVKNGLSEVKRFIDERDKSFEFLVTGLVGKDLGTGITNLLEKKKTELLDKAKTKLTEKIKEVNQKLSTSPNNS